jgi:uncharacterized small protein (DUF1192 family)
MFAVRQLTKDCHMADTTRLSVEKAIEKLRGNERLKSGAEQRDQKIEALNKEISRMKAQRRRLEPKPRKPD